LKILLEIDELELELRVVEDLEAGESQTFVLYRLDRSSAWSRISEPSRLTVALIRELARIYEGNSNGTD